MKMRKLTEVIEAAEINMQTNVMGDGHAKIGKIGIRLQKVNCGGFKTTYRKYWYYEGTNISYKNLLKK